MGPKIIPYKTMILCFGIILLLQSESISQFGSQADEKNRKFENLCF